MERKFAVALCFLVLSWLAINMVIGVQILDKTIYMEGTIISLDFAVVIDGVGYNNGDTMQWGTLNYGENLKSITITNTGEVALYPVLDMNDLPDDWIWSWDIPYQLIEPSVSVSGFLNVTVPNTAVQGQTYPWITVIRGEA